MGAKKTVILSAGGTGGHLFPAEALAQELLSRGLRVVIATDRRGEVFFSLKKSALLAVVASSPMRAGLRARLKAILFLVWGMAQSTVLFLRYRPSVVVGFGGYPSFPTVRAAQVLGIPTVLHEQNGVLGKANQVLSKKARFVAASLPGLKALAPVVVTGNPVRAEIVALASRDYQPPKDQIYILVTGGSQGARSFAEVLVKAVLLLPQDLQSRLFLAQQCLEDQVDYVREAYAQAVIAADVAPFFKDVSDRLAKAHLFIGRSGATTVSEIALVGVPALFIPDPRHVDMQQKINAEIITSRGGGWMMLHQDFTPENVAQKLLSILQDPQKLTQAAQQAKSCAQPHAAQKLADLIAEFLK